jgi:hypothetical protein
MFLSDISSRFILQTSVSLYSDSLLRSKSTWITLFRISIPTVKYPRSFVLGRFQSVGFMFRRFPCHRIPFNVSTAGSAQFRQTSYRKRSGSDRKFLLNFRPESGAKEFTGSDRNLPDTTGIDKNCTGTGSDLNGSGGWNDRPGMFSKL